mgnify:FL=1
MREAIVLVGGEGTRLRPLTLTTPKPLLPVAGVPLLAHQFARLRDAGIERVVLATSYRADLFDRDFAAGFQGMDIVCATEPSPMGTGGAIAHAGAMLSSAADDPVIVLNGDVLSGHDVRAQLRRHTDADADVTLHLVQVSDPRRFGCVPTNAQGRVTDFLEKMDNPVTDQINAGCYVLRRSVIDDIPTDRPVSVERETFPGLLRSGALVEGYLESAYWLDLGTPAAYLQGSHDLVTGVLHSSALTGPIGESLLLADAAIDPTAVIAEGSVIGQRSSVAATAWVHDSVVMDSVVIGEGTHIQRSLIGTGCVIGANCVLRDVVLGDATTLAAGAHFESQRIWRDGDTGDLVVDAL